MNDNHFKFDDQVTQENLRKALNEFVQARSVAPTVQVLLLRLTRSHFFIVVGGDIMIGRQHKCIITTIISYQCTL